MKSGIFAPSRVNGDELASGVQIHNCLPNRTFKIVVAPSAEICRTVHGSKYTSRKLVESLAAALEKTNAATCIESYIRDITLFSIHVNDVLKSRCSGHRNRQSAARRPSYEESGQPGKRSSCPNLSYGHIAAISAVPCDFASIFWAGIYRRTTIRQSLSQERNGQSVSISQSAGQIQRTVHQCAKSSTTTCRVVCFSG